MAGKAQGTPGFAPAWLALREPYDHAARDRALTAALAGALAARPSPWRLLDLACGAGSGFRYLAPALARPQHWTLLDHDPVLLRAAAAETRRWAAGRGLEVRDEAGGLAVGSWRLQLRQHSLLGPSLTPEGAWDAVVTSALLDLVSRPWLIALADWLAAERLPLLAALTVDGRAAWDPPDPDDATVHAWFRAHQHTDRGFGPSPGPEAAAELERLLRARGFSVTAAPADWRIHRRDPSGPALIEEMIRGIAHAAAEVSPSPERVEAWRERRLAATRGLLIGHRDLLALPEQAERG